MVDEAQRRLDAELTRVRLLQALTAFGLELQKDAKTELTYWLSATDQDRPRHVGVAIIYSTRADLVLWDTVWIGLRRPLSIALQPHTSAERMFEIMNERLMRALRASPVRTRRALSSERRYLMCTKRDAHNGFAVTAHTRQGGITSKRWRCDECHYDLVLP